MELLIPGLILVALMAYASTRIKKTAARAFEPETIETEDFVIQKPEEFLNVIGGDPQFVFEAYSKDFGSGGAADTRQATAKLRIFDHVTIDEALADLSAENDIISDIGEVIGGQKYHVVEAKGIENDIEFRVLYKIAERNGQLYRLEVRALSDVPDDLTRRLDDMLSSFEIKGAV